MSTHNSFIASYATAHLARDSVRHLEDEGFDLGKLFIIARDQHRDIDFKHAKCIHHLSELGPDLYNCIPSGDAADYEAEVQAGRVILVAHGSPEEVEQAKTISDKLHMPNWDNAADTAVYYGCND